MENSRLVTPDSKYEYAYMDFIKACGEDIQACGMTQTIPLSSSSSFSADIKNLLNYAKGIDLPMGWVSASTYWLMTESNNCILGVINIRHQLTDYLQFRGGHIGYYVHLSERQKGYATRMLQLALEKCEELEIKRVLITCAKSNIGSAKTIINNGGVLDSEDIDNGEIFQRYWIGLGK